MCVRYFHQIYLGQTFEGKKGKRVLNGFIEIINKSECQPNKLWVDQRSEFYNSPAKCLDNNGFLMNLTHSEGKSIVAEMFIRSLKSKIYNVMTSNNKKSYLGYLNKLADEYNNSCYHFIGKKPIDADYSTLTEDIDTNPKSPKFKVGDRVRINKHINIFSKDYTKNWSKEILVIDSVFKTNPWTYKMKNVNGKQRKFWWKRIVVE